MRTDVSSTTLVRTASCSLSIAADATVAGSRSVTDASLSVGDAAGEVANGVLLYRSERRGMVDAVATTVESVAGCVFCAIVAGDAEAEIVHRDDVAVAFLDRTPLFPGHLLVVPTTHVVTLADLTDVGPFFERVQRMAAAVPARPRCAGHVRRQQQRRQPERRPPPRARRPAHQGRRAARLLLAPVAATRTVRRRPSPIGCERR